LAASLTVHFPWRSLLRGVLGHDDAVLMGIAQLLAPGAEVTALVSVLPHDNAPAMPSPDALAAAYRRHGLGLIEAREATPVEAAASHSSWAKRLRAGAERPVTLLRARAPGRGQRDSSPAPVTSRAPAFPRERAPTSSSFSALIRR
jgi:16S rRNA (adenine(1408)-N(1))-methyltransferase